MRCVPYGQSMAWELYPRIRPIARPDRVGSLATPLSREGQQHRHCVWKRIRRLRHEPGT